MLLDFVALAGSGRRSIAPPRNRRSALPDTVDAYGMVFDQWVKKREPKTAILVVRRGGKTVFAKGHGADPMKPTLIASLSKAITGACVATLVRDGKLAFTTPLRDALPQFFKQYGAPVDRASRSGDGRGAAGAPGGLARQRRRRFDLRRLRQARRQRQGWLAAPKPVLSEYLLKDRLARHPGGRYSYSNTGYEILTAIIEEQTGRPYEDYCGEAVFGKLGIAMPKLHPDWRMLSGAGGWFIPGPDYLAFLDIFDPAHPFLGDTVKSLDRPGADPMDPDQQRPLVQPRRQHLGRLRPLGGVARRHPAIRAARTRRAGRPRRSVVSHAFRAADGTAVFIALEWTPRRARDRWTNCAREIGETHKLVTMLP